MKKNLWIVLTSCLLVIMACSSLKQSTKNNKNHLSGVEWKLVSVKAVNDSVIIAPSTEAVPTLLFDSKEGRISGLGGCNRFMGSYTAEGNSLKFGNIATTMMMCFDQMDIESAVLNAFQETNSYKLQNQELFLMHDTTVLATYSK